MKMSYYAGMNLTIRKCTEQQAQLTASAKVRRMAANRLCLYAMLLLLTLVPCAITSAAKADIYRFVTIDGVETFTDAPSDKKATVVIKDTPKTSAKQRASSKKKKIHEISIDEIAQKVVTASINPQEQTFEPRLPPVGGVITSKVGMRVDPIDGNWRLHNGIDIAIPSGTPVRSVASGIVIYSSSRSGYGNTVVVEHDNGIITLYAHNNQLLVTQGQPVSTETVLALSGSTGRSTGPHLHFEAWRAGANVTMAFLPDSGMTIPKTTLVASSQRTPRFRSETLSDGSILFTNIPASTP